jgi:hypothetical protein
MNPQDLIAPQSTIGNPAPFWFITLFKVLGFILHMIPMNIWYAGMLLVAIFGTFGKDNYEELAHRLARAMPLIVALGINFGIVPLLFTQVGYYQFYYPAGVLIGWPWLSVIALLTVAYYGVYVYSLSVRKNKKTKISIASAWVSSILFIIIGFLFTNNFSLMVNIGNWINIFNRTNVGGAPTGLALNATDPTLVPRWLMMFGIAIMTTAVYIMFDAFYLRRSSTSSQYKAWAVKFAFAFFTIGMIWYAVVGSWYIFGTLDKFALTRLGNDPLMIAIFILTAVSPGAPWITLLLMRIKVSVNLPSTNKRWVAIAAGTQFITITLNAISRQWLQNTELLKYSDVSQLTVHTQWSPMITFLILFAIGLVVVGWMLSKIIAIEQDAEKV